MIICDNVSRRYGPDKGISNVSVTFGDGVIHCVLGKNGSGKSTLFRCVAGLEEPDSGSVFLGGKSVYDPRLNYLLRKDISWFPSESYLYDDLTVGENLGYLSEIKHREKDAWKSLGDVIGSLEMDSAIETPLGALSFGMRRKAHLIASLIGRPRYIVWDEPQNGLDLFANARIDDLLMGFARAGCVVVFSTHIIEIAEKISDRILLLDSSRIIGDFSKETVAGRGLMPLLDQAYADRVSV